MRGTGVVAAAAATVVVSLALAAAEAAPDYTYEYDAAGRLVRVGDGSGRYLRYDLDPSGNVLSARIARYWHAKVAKPARGAWVLAVEEDGTVGGFGADDLRGVYDLGGTLVLEDGLATGTLEIRDPGDGTVLASFPLEKSKVKADRRTGAPAGIVLKSAGDGTHGPLKAAALLPGPAFSGFRGVFSSSKNQATAPEGRVALGEVRFAAEGTRPAVTRVSGALEGTLIRDPSGKAYGEVSFDGSDFVVLAKLKDGAKSVRAKSGRGSPAPLKVAVKR